MPVDFLRNAAGQAWHTMTSGDIELCLDYAARFDPHRGQAWMDAFFAKAFQLGYRDGAGRCNCAAGVHGPDCGLGKLYQAEQVWPHDSDEGLLLNERLPSPPNYAATLPVERRVEVQAHALPPIPDDAPEYAGGIPDSDPDNLAA